MNLGNPGEFTIKQLAEEVMKTCDSKSGFTYLPLPADDPRQRKPDITRAQTLLGWNPTIPLREGLKKTVEDFQGKSQRSGSLKILLLNQCFYPDVVSTAQHLTDLATALAARGHEVTVIASDRGYDDPATRFQTSRALERHRDHSHSVAVVWQEQSLAARFQLRQLSCCVFAAFADAATFRRRRRAHIAAADLISRRRSS